MLTSNIATRLCYHSTIFVIAIDVPCIKDFPAQSPWDTPLTGRRGEGMGKGTGQPCTAPAVCYPGYRWPVNGVRGTEEGEAPRYLLSTRSAPSPSQQSQL